jgi:predicted MFS family arabinose efflux permease
MALHAVRCQKADLHHIGPSVLVEVFKQPVATMTLLFFIIAVIGIFVKPWVGHLIDKVGERIVLSTEAFLFFLTCLGYAFAEDLFSPSIAIALIYVCYVADFTLDSVYMARVTYMKKIALKPEDVSPSLSLGTSVDHGYHLPSILGGRWSKVISGYKCVFRCGQASSTLCPREESYQAVDSRQSVVGSAISRFRKGGGICVNNRTSEMASTDKYCWV